jgi:uncharacterized membrane protein
MTRHIVLIYGIGALILGAAGLISGDFALQWQPVPDTLPLHAPLAYASALLLTAAGIACFSPRTSSRSALVLGALYASWVVFLHAPRALAKPADVGAWLGFAEILALTTGGMLAWLMSRGDGASSTQLRVGQATFAACLALFGLSHFVYADFTAAMVPAWIPFRLLWAYATGCGHIAAAISLVSGVATRLATTLLVAMFASFVLLLHLPRVLADPTSHVEWVMLGVATSLAGAAWIVRVSATFQYSPPAAARSAATSPHSPPG